MFIYVWMWQRFSQIIDINVIIHLNFSEVRQRWGYIAPVRVNIQSSPFNTMCIQVLMVKLQINHSIFLDLQGKKHWKGIISSPPWVNGVNITNTKTKYWKLYKYKARITTCILFNMYVEPALQHMAMNTPEQEVGFWALRMPKVLKMTLY